MTPGNIFGHNVRPSMGIKSKTSFGGKWIVKFRRVETRKVKMVCFAMVSPKHLLLPKYKICVKKHKIGFNNLNFT